MKKLFLALFLVTLTVAAPAQAWQASGNGVEIYVFRVGQADSMLIVGPGPARRTLLVDMGVSQQGAHTGTVTADHVADRIFEITGRRHVDYFLLTHFHEDHLGTASTGMAWLIDRPEGITIGTVIDTASIGVDYVWPPYTTANDTNHDPRPAYAARVVEWQRREAIERRVLPQFGTGQIDLGGGVRIDILAFGGQFAADAPSVHVAYERGHDGYYRSHKASENDLSIAFELSLGDFEFWSAGDLSGADGAGTAERSGGYINVEYPMVRSWAARGRESDVEIYRASHHGARYSSGVPFLEALDPEHIIYSADVRHGHPTREVVGRVLPHVRQYATGLDRHWTDRRRPEDPRFESLNGQLVEEVRIIVSADGSRYTINGAPFRSFSDAEEARNLDRR